MAKQLFGICASPLRTSSDPLCPSMREIHISQTREYFIIPWQGLRSHHPGAQGCCQLHSRAGCQCPSTCQLSAPFTPLLPGWRQESLKRWQNRSSSADTCWHSAIRILSFSLSLVSESYMGKDALPAWIAICSPQCSRKAASNQSSLTFFLALLKWFRVSGCQYFFFFLKKSREGFKEAMFQWSRHWEGGVGCPVGIPAVKSPVPGEGPCCLWGGRKGMTESWEHWLRICLNEWKSPALHWVNSWPLGEELPGMANTSHLLMVFF